MGPGSRPAYLWPGCLSHLVNVWARVSPSSQAYVGLAVIEGELGGGRVEVPLSLGLQGRASPSSPSSSSHKHALTYRPSLLPSPWRAQKKSCPSFSGS